MEGHGQAKTNGSQIAAYLAICKIGTMKCHPDQSEDEKYDSR